MHNVSSSSTLIIIHIAYQLEAPGDLNGNVVGKDGLIGGDGHLLEGLQGIQSTLLVHRGQVWAIDDALRIYSTLQ